MTDHRPASLAAAELQQLLRQLGQSDAPAPRGLLEESGREARISARVDAELARLIRRRRSVTRGVTLAAAAALALVGFRFVHLSGDDGAVAIGQEPLRSGRARSSSEGAGSHLPAAPLAASGAPLSGPRPLSPGLVGTSEGSDSTLAEENRLFKEAADATRKGDVDAALSRLDELLKSDPGSPLAQTALVKKFRILSQAGRANEARLAARRYLDRYPDGFAREEAEVLVE